MTKVKVLVVDDSFFMRRFISGMLTNSPGIEVIDTAKNGLEAVKKTLELSPDCITMDVEMPVLDGLEAVRRIMRERPTPIVMLSTLTQEGAEVTLRALSLGAVDFLPKPVSNPYTGIVELEKELQEKVLACGTMRRERLYAASESPAAPAPLALPAASSTGGHKSRLVVIGSSTGGPNALQQIIPRLPGSFPSPMVIVQHMPVGFTRYLAERLNSISPLEVREAREGDSLRPGTVLLAPGGTHLRIDNLRHVRLTTEPTRHGVRPSVDVTLETAAAVAGKDAVGVILTGMGSDGAEGLGCVKRVGGTTLAQDENSCVVYGMPRAAVEMGYVDQIIPLHGMAEAIAGTVV